MRKLAELCTHRCVIHITGPDVKRFLNMCKHNQITLTDMIWDENGVFAVIPYRAWKMIGRLQEKCHVTCSIVMEKGALPFLKKYRKRVLFLVGFLLGLFLVLYSSLFIWHIDVFGTSVYTEEEIVAYICDSLVPIGTKRADISLAELEKNLRMQYDQAAWITCETVGTRLIVRIVETVTEQDVKSFENPCNIVAVKDGMILDLLATSGRKMVDPGDEVKKGDVLITGVVNVYNEYEELIETNYMAAEGVVYGKTVYPYQRAFSMEYTDKNLGKRKKTGISIQVGKNIRKLYVPKKKEGYESMTSAYTLHIGSSYYLPLTFIVTNYYQPEYKTKTYTEEEARKKQELLLQKYIADLKKKGVEILENNVTIQFKDGVCLASGTLVVKEIIGVPEIFTVPEHPIQENEESE